MRCIRLLSVVLSTVFLISYCSKDKGDVSQPEASPRAAFELTSPDFPNNGPIPREMTCQGKNYSVVLNWKNAPRATRAYALIVDDPDATPVVGYAWVHWIVYNIPASAVSLPGRMAKSAKVKLPSGETVTQGHTSWKKPGYGGPCPPKGTGVHHYIFKLYALSEDLKLPEGLTKEKLQQAIKGKSLAETQLVGTYEKK